MLPEWRWFRIAAASTDRTEAYRTPRAKSILSVLISGGRCADTQENRARKMSACDGDYRLLWRQSTQILVRSVEERVPKGCDTLLRTGKQSVAGVRARPPQLASHLATTINKDHPRNQSPARG